MFRESSIPRHYHQLNAIMVSYAERQSVFSNQAMEKGFILLNPGACVYEWCSVFTSLKFYEAFVAEAKPDWYAIPQDCRACENS